jgi:transcriptional regulator with XRE-family HTH domain
MTLDLVATMTDTDFKKAFGARVKEARKSRTMTQKDVAQRMGIHFQLLNKYEGGQTLPQPEKIVTLANLLEVSVDYLLTGRTPDNHGMVDTRLMERVQALNHFPKEDQDAILLMIDAITVRSSVQGSLEKIKPKSGTAG